MQGKILKAAVVSFMLVGSMGSYAQSCGANNNWNKGCSEWSDLSKKKQTSLGLYMTAAQAYDHMSNNDEKTLFLDIRTSAELNYLGVADVMDASVPMYFMDRTRWDDKKRRFVRLTNENFVNDINAQLNKKGLTKNDTVILMCRSGKRSAKAANQLAKEGFTNVYTVVDGYEGDKAKSGKNKGKRFVNGWKNSGLPWTYSLDRDFMHGVSK